MPCTKDRQSFLDSYDLLQDKVAQAHPDWTDSKIRKEAALQFRPRYRLNQESSALENSGVAEYFSTEFTLTEEGHIYFTEYGTSLEQLHQNQILKTPDKYSVVDHQTSRLIEEAFRNGATEVVTTYHRDGADNRDIIRMIYDPDTKKGRQVISNAAPEGNYHTFDGIQKIAESQFFHLQKTQASEQIFILSDTTISQLDVQRTIGVIRPIQTNGTQEHMRRNQEVRYKHDESPKVVVQEVTHSQSKEHKDVAQIQEPIRRYDRKPERRINITIKTVHPEIEDKIIVTPHWENTIPRKTDEQREPEIIITQKMIDQIAEVTEKIAEHPGVLEERIHTVTTMLHVAVVAGDVCPVLPLLAIAEMQKGIAPVIEKIYGKQNTDLLDGVWNIHDNGEFVSIKDQPENVIRLMEIVLDNAQRIKEQFHQTQAALEIVRIVGTEPHPVFVLLALGSIDQAAKPIVLSFSESQEDIQQLLGESLSEFSKHVVIEGKQQSLTVPHFKELVQENGDFLQDQLKEEQKAMQRAQETIQLVGKEPALVFVIAALGNIDRATKPIVLVEKTKTEETKVEKIPGDEYEEKNQQLIKVLTRLIMVMNKYPGTFARQPYISIGPLETPLPKGVMFCIEKNKSILDHDRNMFALLSAFSFMLGMLFLLRRMNEKQELQPKENISFCLLLAIIYYLDQIKEQGAKDMPIQNNQQKKKTTKKKKVLPRSATLYDYGIINL
jgi:hypothetical protein